MAFSCLMWLTLFTEFNTPEKSGILQSLWNILCLIFQKQTKYRTWCGVLHVSAQSWDSAPRGDVDEEVENFVAVKSPLAFRPPPSQAFRRTVSRQSVHSGLGDPLVELMGRMVESSQQEARRRQQDIFAARH